MGRQGRGSHGGDGLVVEGDKGHAKRLLVHLLLLPLVVLLQLLLQLRVVLDGLHLPRASERGGGFWSESRAAPQHSWQHRPRAHYRPSAAVGFLRVNSCNPQDNPEVGTISLILERKWRHRAVKKLAKSHRASKYSTMLFSWLTSSDLGFANLVTVGMGTNPRVELGLR